ncbi:WSCD family member CG9164-like [Mercenaria mercenaria]|uniref:WSCD family member CG9164-like n=1 Tax=Mercenaria mercenaria TaxID=6596 RepID=UPI00234EE204|nr:WSCD family member CG9164-like [Mercenaria mercenaria]
MVIFLKISRAVPVAILDSVTIPARSWILTTKYNLFNYPTFYQRAEKEKARGLKLFENYELPLYNETGALKSDTTCIKRNVSLAETPLPMTGLVSFPGSGNTWTRHLIQQMTGIGTSSVYCDLQLKKGGFPYECYKKRNRTVVIKTHEPKHVTMFTKIVFLIRNPYDAILSYTKFKTGGHTKHSSEEALQQALDESFEEDLKK